MGVGIRVVDLEKTAVGVRRVQSLMYPSEDLRKNSADLATLYIKTKG